MLKVKYSFPMNLHEHQWYQGPMVVCVRTTQGII